MKVTLQFKTPDVLDQIEHLSDEICEFVSKYVKYGEYLTVEFDTETKSVKVLEV